MDLESVPVIQAAAMVFELIRASDGRRSHVPLNRHFDRIDVFKIGLRNAFGIDLRTARRPVPDDEPCSTDLFCYLPEVFPFVEPQARKLNQRRRRAYETIKEHATESFWKIYADFQPFVEASAQSSGIDPDRMAPILGRTILLFEVSRRTRFVSYLDKSIREAAKNIRGENHARELGIPVSAGRLVSQLRWMIDQATSSAGRGISAQESDEIVIEFLRSHTSKFSERTMRHIAEVLRDHPAQVSLDACRSWLEPSTLRDGSLMSSGNDCYVEHEDACRYELQQIRGAISRAQFDDVETCLVLRRLDLPFDEQRFDSLAKSLTSAAIRKRTARLLVRLMAARYAPNAARFGELLHVTATNARDAIVATLTEVAKDSHEDFRGLVGGLLNWMSISDSVYRISIVERGRIEDYLTKEKSRLPSPTFQKLKAALIEQERIGFPCMREL